MRQKQDALLISGGRAGDVQWRYEMSICKRASAGTLVLLVSVNVKTWSDSVRVSVKFCTMSGTQKNERRNV